MNREHEEKEPSFKVVDRRRVNEQGETCEQVDDKAEPIKKAETTSSSDQNKNINEKPSSPERLTINFSIFVQSLAHQAMMGLALAPWPDSGLIKLELNMAKETIEILKILKEKTKNNLDQKEQALLDTIVYQLQVAYVDALKGPAPAGLASS